MIKYADKGSGLTDKINSAGLYLREENGVLMSYDDEAVQALIDNYSLADAQAHKCAEVTAHAKLLRDKVVKFISAGEMASWPIKLSEARGFGAHGDSQQCPMLSAEAAVRGVSVADVVARVGSNATNFAQLEAQIGGTDGKHRDAIKALKTFEEVNTYDFSGGWPGM